MYSDKYFSTTKKFSTLVYISKSRTREQKKKNKDHVYRVYRQTNAEDVRIGVKGLRETLYKQNFNEKCQIH